MVLIINGKFYSAKSFFYGLIHLVLNSVWRDSSLRVGLTDRLIINGEVGGGVWRRSRHTPPPTSLKRSWSPVIPIVAKRKEESQPYRTNSFNKLIFYPI